MMRCALALVLAPVLVFAAACDEEKDSPDTVQRKAMCRQLMEHILQITPRPGSDRPETDPARIKELAAKLPIEDIEECTHIKDPPPPPGTPAPAEGGFKVPKVIACMQAAADVAALRACIPAKTE